MRKTAEEERKERGKRRVGKSIPSPQAPADSWVPPLVPLMPAHPPWPWEPGLHKVLRESYLSHVWEVFHSRQLEYR